MRRCQYLIDGRLASEIVRRIVAEQAATGGSAANVPERLARVTPLVAGGFREAVVASFSSDQLVTASGTLHG